MKLLTYQDSQGADAAGVLDADERSVLDAGRLLGRSETPCAVAELLARPGAIDELRRALDRASEQAKVGELSELTLRAPVPRPGKIVAAGMNYARHIAETGLTPPADMPGFFAKLPSAVIGPRDEIRNPHHLGTHLDYEAELAIVLGADGIDVGQPIRIAGWTVANDVSLRDLQIDRNQLILGKGIDTFCPLGPVLRVADASGALPGELRIESFVNDEPRQASSTGDMVFDVVRIVEIVCAHLTLDPGDVILTGSPEGVGMGMSPPRWLADGDVVTCRIEGVGEISNRVVAW